MYINKPDFTPPKYKKFIYKSNIGGANIKMYMNKTDFATR